MGATSGRKLNIYIFFSFCSNFEPLGAYRILSPRKHFPIAHLFSTTRTYFGRSKTIEKWTTRRGETYRKDLWITRYDFDQSEPIDLSSGRKHFLIMHSFSTPRIRSDGLKSIGISTTRRQKAHRKDVFDYLIWFRLVEDNRNIECSVGHTYREAQFRLFVLTLIPKSISEIQFLNDFFTLIAWSLGELLFFTGAST